MKIKRISNLLAALLVAVLAADSPAFADGESEAEKMAKKLSNPVASLISVPIQANYDENIGLADGYKITTNIQPVIPISLNEDWNLISRTIVPIISQEDIVALPVKTPKGVQLIESGHQSGSGDILQSLFFSPKEPTAGGLIWGAGPVFLIPSGSDELLSSEKFGLGPTAVLLKQEKGWTYGLLTNHVWSVTGEDDRKDVSATFLQPFLSYTTKQATTYTLNTESTYDWEADQWSVPVHFGVSQLFKIGGQLVQVGGFARYWAESPDGGPEGWGARVVVTFLFPT